MTPFKATDDRLFDKVMSSDDGSDIIDKMMVDEDGDLRTKDFAEHTSLSISTLSGGFEIADIYSQKPSQTATREHDRFIPQRNQANTTLNYETKEFLFAKKQFNCTHSANEQCDCIAKNEQLLP